MNNNNNKQYEQFKELTNKLEIACKNSEQLKMTNTDMHSQIEYLKKAYEELHHELQIKEEQLNNMQQKQSKLYDGIHNNNNISHKYKLLKQEYEKQKDKYNVISKKYEILKEHWESLNKDRSNAIEKLKTEAQKVSELEKENQMKDEEKLKWKERTDSLTQAHAMGEVQIQEEIQRLITENSNLKQEVEKQGYEIEDLQNKNNQITQQLNEWKLKYDEINEKYEFESAQHDNTFGMVKQI